MVPRISFLLIHLSRTCLLTFAISHATATGMAGTSEVAGIVWQMNPQSVHDQFATSTDTYAVTGRSNRVATASQSTQDSGPQRALARENVIGLLVSAAEAESLPASTWWIEAALEQLMTQLPSPGTLSTAVGRWQKPGNAVRSRFPGLSEIMRVLVSAGHLQPSGGGPTAVLSVSPTWREIHQTLATTLTPEEQAVLVRVAQRLVAMATTASNRLRTPAPPKLGAITSGVTLRHAFSR